MTVSISAASRHAVSRTVTPIDFAASSIARTIRPP
jgi:hypothetical protein